MTIDMKENTIVLNPETEWERNALKELRKRTITRIIWEDEWDHRGGLMLVTKDRKDGGT